MNLVMQQLGLQTGLEQRQSQLYVRGGKRWPKLRDRH